MKINGNAFAVLVTILVLSLFQARVVFSEETKSALESDPKGWTDIMPPADLKGWYRVPVPPTGKLGRDQWHLDSDSKVLVCDGDGGHIVRERKSGQFVRTDRAFEERIGALHAQMDKRRRFAIRHRHSDSISLPLDQYRAWRCRREGAGHLIHSSDFSCRFGG